MQNLVLIQNEKDKKLLVGMVFNCKCLADENDILLQLLSRFKERKCIGRD